jgi:DNA-binding protein HU-beta
VKIIRAQSTWHIYMIECADGSLYTGITTDVARRFGVHVSGKGARYTRSHKPVRLVASCPVGSRSQAASAEAAIKRMPRTKKISAVGSQDHKSIHHNERGNAMNKSELIEIVAKESDLSKVAAGKILDSLIAAVTKAVAKGDGVTLVGFGSFKPIKRAARVGKNPQTGAALKIAARTVPKFTAGATFKAAVAGKKSAKKK